jgi:acyl-CoA thioester hydrolase
MKIRVYYEDTDCGGIVYYANYLKFCERARSNLFFEKGLSPHNDEEFFVVKKVEAEYIKSAKFSDLLEVTTEIVSKKGASVELLHKIFKDDDLFFSSNVKLVYLKDSKPSRIPNSILEVFDL